MPDVCPLAGASRERAVSAALQAMPEAFSTLYKYASNACSTPHFAESQYQKAFQNTYWLRPRPPQTPPARFKRLYRK